MMLQVMDGYVPTARPFLNLSEGRVRSSAPTPVETQFFIEQLHSIDQEQESYGLMTGQIQMLIRCRCNADTTPVPGSPTRGFEGGTGARSPGVVLHHPRRLPKEASPQIEATARLINGSLPMALEPNKPVRGGQEGFYSVPVHPMTLLTQKTILGIHATSRHPCSPMVPFWASPAAARRIGHRSTPSSMWTSSSR